jgi:hypothetical protein
MALITASKLKELRNQLLNGTPVGQVTINHESILHSLFESLSSTRYISETLDAIEGICLLSQSSKSSLEPSHITMLLPALKTSPIPALEALQAILVDSTRLIQIFERNGGLTTILMLLMRDREQGEGVRFVERG